MVKQQSHEKKFLAKVSFFNALGATLAVGVPTYVDPKLKTHAYHPGQTYPLGLWVLLVGPIVLVLTYLCMTQFTKRKWHSSWLPLAIVDACALWNFRAEFPHINVVIWTACYCLASFVASRIRFARVEFKFADDAHIHINARIERIKESISQWRTISVSMTTGYLALTIPWIAFLWISCASVVTDKKELFTLQMSQGIELLAFSTYVCVGPIIEAFSKYLFVSDGLLAIKNTKEGL